MELLVGLLVALPTVFLAALLAVMLENMRERARTRRWVVRNLKALVATFRSGPIEGFVAVEAAVQRWLEASSPEDMDEQTWRQLQMNVTTSVPDISSLIRSEAATSVSAEVFAAIHGLDDKLREAMEIATLLNESHREDIRPLWYEQRVPLAGADARRVAAFRDTVRATRTRLESYLAAEQRFRDVVEGI